MDNSTLQRDKDLAEVSRPENSTLFLEFANEFAGLPEEVRSKYAAKIAPLLEYVKTYEEKNLGVRMDSPFFLHAEAFRGYLFYLKAAMESGKEACLILNSADGNEESKKRRWSLLLSIAKMSVVADGKEAVGSIKDGKVVGANLSALEKKVVEGTVLEEDYLLFLKLAEDGGTEFARLASKLIFILETRNMEASLEEVAQREDKIDDGLKEAFESKEWEMMRLLPTDHEEHTPEQMFWLAADDVFIKMSKGLPMEEAYKKAMKGIVDFLVLVFLNKFKNQGEAIKEGDMEELVACCYFLGYIPAWRSGEKPDDKKDAKELLGLLYARLAEIIGPKFLQQTLKPVEMGPDLAKKINGGSAEELWGEMQAVMSLIRSTSSGEVKVYPEGMVPKDVDEKYLVEYKGLITENYGLAKFLETRAIQEIKKYLIIIKKEGKTLSKEQADNLVRDVAILNMTLDGIPSEDNGLKVLKTLYLLKTMKPADQVYERAMQKFWSNPEAIRITLRGLTIGSKVSRRGDSQISASLLIDILSPNFLKRNARIVDDLAEELIKGDYTTFMNACVVAGSIIESEKGWGQVAQAVAKKLFCKREDCLNPERVMVLRNITALLRDDVRPVFFKKAFADNSFFVGVTGEERARLGRMLDMEVDGDDGLKQLPDLKKTDLEGLKIDGELEERNLGELAEYILANGSIMLSADGKILTIMAGDSPLAENFSEIKLGLNRKENRKNPRSLASLVTLKMKNGSSWYFSIDAENNLKWRNFREGQLIGEMDMEQFLTAEGGDKEKGVAIWKETHYLILKKLEELFVRKAAKAKDVVIESREIQNDTVPAESETERPSSEPPSSGPVLTEGVAVAEVREERPGVVDLADQFAEATRMVFQDLEAGSEDEKDEARRIRVKIGANRQLALQIFGEALAKAARREDGGRVILSELLGDVPDGLADLIVYRMEILDSEKYFEEIDPLKAYEDLRNGKISADKIFVRSGSAHSQALPYLKVELAGELKEAEAGRINRFWKETLPKVDEGERRSVREGVLRARAHDEKMALRREMFASSRESKDINMAAREKILYFDVDDLPEHREIFERMKKISAEEIRADVGHSMRKELQEKLREAKARLVDPSLNGAAYMAGVSAYETEKEKLEKEGEANINKEVQKELEIQSRFTTVTQNIGEEKKFVKLRLPAAFKFNQTFNQGRFQSLTQLFESLDPAAKKKYDVQEVA